MGIEKEREREREMEGERERNKGRERKRDHGSCKSVEFSQFGVLLCYP